jgi:class 3 adenylate cyclase
MQIAPLPPDEAERLEALARYEVLDTDPDAVLDELTELASLICDVPVSLVSMVDADRQWFKSRVGVDARETPRDLAFCAHAILQERIMEIPDAKLDERFHDNPLVTGPPLVRFYAGAPLRTPDGHAVGTLCVIDHVPRHLDAKQRRALEVLGARVVDHLELTTTARMLARATRRAVGLEHILETYTPRDVWQRLRVDTDLPGRPHLVGERLDRTYLFADICDFTALAGRRGSAEVAGLVSACLGRVVSAVHARGGDIEKFIGDSVFAVLPDPLSAVEVARAVQASLLRDPVPVDEGGVSRLQLSIGIHCGEAVRAHVGTEERRDNTLIGGAVNLAARLQVAAGHGQTLVSERCWLRAGLPAQAPSVSLALKGVPEPVRAYFFTEGDSA